MNLFDKIHETASFIKAKIQLHPSVGIILGSGLVGLTEFVEQQATISYTDIPHFPVSTVQGHAGQLIFGKLRDKNVVLMAGRFHYYEGYTMEEVTFPVRVMKALGVETMIISNAAGAMNSAYNIGDLVIIADHINLFPEHPLRGPNDERLGVRFPDMSEPYDRELIRKARYIAGSKGLTIHEGVYIGLQGPTFETRAEYKWLNVIGGDVVGMSTVPEVIVAKHGGMRVFATSVVTDLGIGDEVNTITHEEVLEAASAAAPKLAALIADLIGQM